MTNATIPLYLALTYQFFNTIQTKMTLNKKAIARSIHQGTGVSFAQAYEFVVTTFEIIKTTLASGEDVLISGFGKFKIKEKNARKGRNPQTGEDLMLKSRKVVTFRCSGRLRERLSSNA